MHQSFRPDSTDTGPENAFLNKEGSDSLPDAISNAFLEGKQTSREGSLEESFLRDAGRSSDIRTEGKINEDSLDTGRSIYEAAGVDVDNPLRPILADREFTTHKIPQLKGDLVGPDGMTNSERAQNGLAAYADVDGRLVKIDMHHHRQQRDGPLVELDGLTHRRYHADLHPGLGKGEGRGDDPLWSQRVSEYWKQREFTN